MAMKFKLFFTLLQTVVWFWLKNVCYGTESDLVCLQKLRQSLRDPENNIFYSWKLDNKSEGSICKLIGVECWHSDESKVLNLHLSNMGLVGQFPSGLENCTSLTGLDLSNNNLSGPIPPNISKRIPFVTSLDLSFNVFSGSIPVNLSNCSYLNSLKLQHNQLTGMIPAKLSRLDRLHTFDVSDNQLTGPIPEFKADLLLPSNFVNNPALCGKPLDDCTGARASKKTIGQQPAILVAAGALIVVGILYICMLSIFIGSKSVTR